MSARTARIGELLLGEGLIDRDELDRAVAEAEATGCRLGYTLVKLGFVGEHELALLLARQHRVPAVDLERAQLDPRLLQLIPAEVAIRHLAVPLRRVGRTLTVAVPDPGDVTTLEDLKFVSGLEIEPVIAGEFALRRIVEREYDSGDPRIDEILSRVGVRQVDGVREEDDDHSSGTLQVQVEEAPVIRLIDGILSDAVEQGASDIHLECYEREVRIRYRIDGVLREVMRPPPKMKAALISRFKILADLNIAERRLPQDGRIKLQTGNRIVDFRVSTLPALFGEKVVLRILDRENIALDLESFGMEPKAHEDFVRSIASPYGMVLVTGPTGSGKTTTLYSALSRINTDEINILTIEDPVEYNLPGINQVQVRSEIGMTFATALRSFLRQDPNVIMVGEIRDQETGSIAIKAALTGHLVLSTLHTNDAPSTITRMIDMGIEPFNVASAVNLITAQRLVRRICSECSEAVTYPPEHLEAAGLRTRMSEMRFRRGRGCTRCGGTGYRGRQGLYEVMAMSPALRRLVLSRASAAELRDAAIAEGMLTLRMDGLAKIQRGVTTLEEVLKETAN